MTDIRRFWRGVRWIYKKTIVHILETSIFNKLFVYTAKNIAFDLVLLAIIHKTLIIVLSRFVN